MPETKELGEGGIHLREIGAASAPALESLLHRRQPPRAAIEVDPEIKARVAIEALQARWRWCNPFTVPIGPPGIVSRTCAC